MRKSADRSTTRAPRSSSAPASFIATPLGVAKNTTSQPPSVLPSGSVNASSRWRRSPGNRALTGVPASLREVIARNSTSGCWTSRRRSSTPVYPVPPTMPALIIGPSQKQESRPKAAFDLRCFPGSTFRVLLAPPRLVQSHFLSLHLSRVAGHEPRRAERAFKPRIILDQRARNAVAHRARLPALAAAIDVDEDVEPAEVLRQLERLAHDHAAGLARKELVHRLAVDDEVALAGLEEHAGHCALAPPRAVVVIADHQISRFFGCCAEWGCLSPAYTLSFRSIA